MQRLPKILLLISALLIGFGATTASAAQSTTTTSAQSTTTTTTKGEAYPPIDVFLGVLEPGCGPAHIDGTIRNARPNSTVTITITQGSTVLGTASVTTDANGDASFVVTIPAGVTGTVTVTAKGLRKLQVGNPESSGWRYQPLPGDQPFTLTEDLLITACGPLPDTGSSLTVPLMRIAGVAVVGGALLFVVGVRRRQRQAA